MTAAVIPLQTNIGHDRRRHPPAERAPVMIAAVILLLSEHPS